MSTTSAYRYVFDMQTTLGRVLGETDKGTLAIIPCSSKSVLFQGVCFDTFLL